MNESQKNLIANQILKSVLFWGPLFWMVVGGYFYWRDNHAYNHPFYLERLRRTVDQWPNKHHTGTFEFSRTPYCKGSQCQASIRAKGAFWRGVVREWDCSTDPCKEGEILYNLDRD